MNANILEKVRLDILDDLSSWLRGCYRGTTTGSATFGTTDPHELELRFVGTLLILARLHELDDRGRCRLCRPRRGRRWRWPTRKSPCQVLKIVAFFATANEEDVWLRLAPRLGIRVGLNELRAHLKDRAATRDLAPKKPIPHQVTDSGRHFLSP
jgi:hypothetical protein